MAAEHTQTFRRTAEHQPDRRDGKAGDHNECQRGQGQADQGIPHTELGAVRFGGEVVRAVFNQLAKLPQQQVPWIGIGSLLWVVQTGGL